MRTPPFRRTAAVLLLVMIAIVAAPPAFAAGPRPETFSLAMSPLETLGHLWSFLRAAWSKDGCSINPNGQCKPGPPSPPPAQAKEGCSIGPDGRCKPGMTSLLPVQIKDGCNIDPSGQCKP